MLRLMAKNKEIEVAPQLYAEPAHGRLYKWLKSPFKELTTDQQGTLVLALGALALVAMVSVK